MYIPSTDVPCRWSTAVQLVQCSPTSLFAHTHHLTPKTTHSTDLHLLHAIPLSPTNSTSVFGSLNFLTKLFTSRHPKFHLKWHFLSTFKHLFKEICIQDNFCDGSLERENSATFRTVTFWRIQTVRTNNSR